MKSRCLKRKLNNRFAEFDFLKFGLLTVLALLSVILLRTFSTHAEPSPTPPAGILFFVTTLDDHDDGACNADCTLREAIKSANANPGDDDGIEFSVTGTVNLLSELPDITGGVSIFGPGALTFTVRRDSIYAFPIFTVTTPGTVAFSGMTISNGFSSSVTGGGAAGGIQHTGTGTLNIVSCAITNNTCEGCTGGAITNSDTGTLNVTDSLISDNKAKYGTINNRAGLVTITNTAMIHNEARQGGGILNAAGTVNVINSTISDQNGAPFNFSSAVGGAIYNDDGVVNLSGCTMSGNLAEQGGAIVNFGIGTVNVTNSLIKK